MSQTNTVYSVLLFIAALVSAWVAAVAWRRRAAPGGWPLIILMTATAFWSGTYAIHWSGFPRPSPFFWLDATYVGVVIVPAAFLAFVLQFTDRGRWLTRPVVTLLIGEPVLTLALLWTDPWHGLFFGGQRTPTAGAILKGGPWFWTNAIYSYALLLFALGLLVTTYRQAPALYRKQMGLIVAGVSVPLVVSIASVMLPIPWPNLDISPFLFTVSGTFFAYAIFRYRFLGIVPAARGAILASMSDGILVWDVGDRLLEANPAARQMLGLIAHPVGEGLQHALAHVPELLRCCEESGSVRAEVSLPGPRYLDVRIIPLADRRGRTQGRLAILRDITEAKQAEQERERLIQSLQDALGQVKTLRGLLPICANCKKIRDDFGYWRQVEDYIHEHSEADFSHGLCPDCMRKLYPDMFPSLEDCAAKVRELLAQAGPCTARSLAAVLDLPYDYVADCLRHMVEEGKAVVSGEGERATYRLL